MTTAENLDLRTNMANAIACFEMALEALQENDLFSARVLWEGAQKQAHQCRILLVTHYYNKEATM